MKKIIILLVFVSVTCQLMTSCNSNKDILSQFSKRKYLQKQKTKSYKAEHSPNYEENVDVSFDMNELEIVAGTDDVLSMIVSEKNQSRRVTRLEVKKDFSKSSLPIKNIYDKYLEKFEKKETQLLEEKEVLEQEIEPNSEKSENASAIVGFVCSLMPVFAGGFIMALIFSSIALKKINENPDKYKGKGLATAGFILGLVGLVFAIVLFVSLSTLPG